jgi:hypothetical protein
MNKKEEKRMAAKQALDEFHSQKLKEKSQRANTNIEEEKNYRDQETREKSGPNPWERVCSNCELNANSYVGGKDVTRLRQSMISRKADIAKSGGMKKII